MPLQSCCDAMAVSFYAKRQFAGADYPAIQYVRPAPVAQAVIRPSSASATRDVVKLGALTPTRPDLCDRYGAWF
jgi:hypothetical protein